MQSIFSSVFGNNVLPQIVNPLDKILVDLNKYANPPQTLLASIPVQGFVSLLEQTNISNQVTNLLNQFVQMIPAIPTVSIPPQVSGLEQIFTSATNFANEQLQVVTSGGQLTPLQKQINNILSLVEGSSKSTFNPPPAVPDDSTQGGSFNNVGPIATFTASQTSTMQYPNPNLSPDPSIATDTNNQTISQTNANAPGTPNVQNPGDGINIFPDLPFRPRGILISGSPGDYAGSKLIPFS